VLNCLLSPFNFLESTLYGMGATAPAPDTLSPVSRGRGEDCVFGGQSSGRQFGLTRSREAAKGNAWRAVRCVLNCLLSPFNFLESTLYGMDAMAPAPRPLSPVSRGRGEDCVFGGQSVAGSLVHAKPRSRERKTRKAVFGFRWMGRGFEVKCVVADAGGGRLCSVAVEMR
jgi:hypothetical protein